MAATNVENQRTVRVPQQERSRSTRAAIVKSALTVFEDRGYDATTTAHIAKETGIAVGTLYGYFRDKREILLEVVNKVLDPLAEHAVHELSEERCAGREIEEIIHTFVGAAFDSQALQPGIQRVLWECYFRDENFREPLVAMRERIAGAISEFAGRQAATGRLRPIPLDAAAFTVLHLVQWNATQAFMHLDKDGADEVATVASEMILRYLFFDAEPAPGS